MGKRVDLILVSSLYSDPDEKGFSKCIKRNIKTKINIDVDYLEYPSQIYNDKGKVLKNKCKVQIRDVGSMTVNHSYEYIKKLKDKDTRSVIKGFRR